MNLAIREGDTVSITDYVDAIDTTTGKVTSDLKKGSIGKVVSRELLLKVEVEGRFYILSGENVKIELLPTMKDNKKE